MNNGLNSNGIYENVKNVKKVLRKLRIFNWIMISIIIFGIHNCVCVSMLSISPKMCDTHTSTMAVRRLNNGTFGVRRCYYIMNSMDYFICSFITLPK